MNRFVSAAKSFSTAAVQQRTKLNAPHKRAGSLIKQLDQEQVELSKDKFPNFLPGDAIQVKQILNKTTGKFQLSKGVVLARKNRGLGSSFTIRNHIGGVAVEQLFPLYAPSIDEIKILSKRFIHKGKKRVRRSKLYYLRDKPPVLTTV